MKSNRKPKSKFIVRRGDITSNQGQFKRVVRSVLESQNDFLIKDIRSKNGSVTFEYIGQNEIRNQLKDYLSERIQEEFHYEIGDNRQPNIYFRNIETPRQRRTDEGRHTKY